MRVISWREPAGTTTFVSTNKDIPFQGGKEELAYWMLAKRIDDKFGGAPATVAEIYHQVAGPMGLSSYETTEVVKKAKKMGYLKVGNND
jgi:hypothetical protein